MKLVVKILNVIMIDSVSCWCVWGRYWFVCVWAEVMWCLSLLFALLGSHWNLYIPLCHIVLEPS